MNQENHTLRMENQYLKDRLDGEFAKEDETNTQNEASDPDNPSVWPNHGWTWKTYEDGFHVCNLFWKTTRGDSPCAFCLEVICRWAW